MAIEKKPWQRLLYEIWDAVVNNGGGGGGGQTEIGNLQECCGVFYNDNEQKYYRSGDYLNIWQIKVNDTPIVKAGISDTSIGSIIQTPVIASGITIYYNAISINPNEEEIVLHFFEATLADEDTGELTIVQELDVDYELIELEEIDGYTYYTAELTVPEVAENSYFAIQEVIQEVNE